MVFFDVSADFRYHEIAWIEKILAHKDDFGNWLHFKGLFFKEVHILILAS